MNASSPRFPLSLFTAPASICSPGMHATHFIPPLRGGASAGRSVALGLAITAMAVGLRGAELGVLDGLVLRLESTAGITQTADAVSNWADQSGNGHDAFQAQADRQPRLVSGALPSGAPVVRFDGQGDLLTLAGQVISSENFTLVAVVNATPGDAGNKNLFGNWSASAGRFGDSVFVGVVGYQPAAKLAIVRFSDAFANAGQALDLPSHFVLDFVNDLGSEPTLAKVSQNGVLLGSRLGLTGRNLAADPDIGPYTIGAQGDPNHGVSAGEFWPGDIAALLVYDRALASEELDAVRRYLSDTFLEPVAPSLVALSPPPDSLVGSLTSVTLTFSEAVAHVDVGDLLINGEQTATELVVISAREYTFKFPRPPKGPAVFSFAANHGITDLAGSPNAFAGQTWSYISGDTAPPTLANVNPPRNTVVSSLTSVSIRFDEPVTGVDASDLLLNGGAAGATLTVASPRDYLFQFVQPAAGEVRLSFAAGHGIRDLAEIPNAFGGTEWVYHLDPGAPALPLEGLVLHLDAAAGASPDEAGRVAGWSDLSGNGHDAFQENPDRQPFFVGSATASGAPALRFDGANDLLTLAGQVITSEDFSIFAVINARPNDSGHKNLFGNWSAAAGNFGSSVFVGLTGYQPETDSATVRFTDAKPSAGRIRGIGQHFLLDFTTDKTADPAFSEVTRNGVPLFTDTPLTGRNLSSNPDTAPYLIGAQGDPDHGVSAGEHWSGDIAAVLVYDRPLQPEERSQIRQYLHDRFLEPVAPSLANIQPADGTVVAELGSVTLQFSEPVGGVEAADLLINGAASATQVIQLTASDYRFEFPSPPVGPVTFAFVPNHGIQDLATRPNVFPGATWTVTRGDFTRPVLTVVNPPAGSTVPALTTVRVIFSEPVANVDAGDLLVNGVVPATAVTANSASDYSFELPATAPGAVSLRFRGNHGIVDLATPPNAFAGADLNYVVDPSIPGLPQEGLVMRLESAFGVVSDTADRVSRWIDQTGNGHDAFQGSLSRQPLRVSGALPSGAGVLRFDGNNDLLTLAGQVVTSQSFSLFSIVNATPRDAGNKNLFGNWSAAVGNFGSSLFVGITRYAGDTDTATVRFSDARGSAGTVEQAGSHFILDFLNDRDSESPVGEVSQGGLLISGGAALPERNLTSNPDTAPYVIGAQGDPDHGVSAGEYWTGDVAAVLVYDRALTEDERNLVRAYLHNTYLAAPPLRLTVRLVAGPTGPAVRVSWPSVTGAGQLLQSTRSLLTGPWESSSQPNLEGQELVVIEPLPQPGAGSRFYRLVQP